MPFNPAFPNYVEFPKWIAGVLVHSREEEREILAAAEAMALRTAGGNQLLSTLTEASADTEPTPQAAPAEAAPLEPQPARPAPSVREMCPTPTTSIIAEVVPMPIAAQPARPSSSGERMARMRARQRNGRRSVLLDVTAVQIEALVQVGFLDATRRDDAGEIARGVGRLLDRHATPPSPRS